MDVKIRRILFILARVSAMICAVAGILLIGMYFWTVIPLFVTDAPDKSLAFWLSIFLMTGILALRFSWSMLRFLRQADRG